MFHFHRPVSTALMSRFGGFFLSYFENRHKVLWFTTQKKIGLIVNSWGVGICMVKLRFDKSKRRYKNGRRIYEYDRITLVFPREYHDILKPFRDMQLSIQVVRKDQSLSILLSEKKQP
jgi:hypothetical protein